MARSGSASTSLSSLTPTSGSSAESSPVRGEGREKDARGAKRAGAGAGTREYDEDFEEDADELGMDEDDEDDQEDGDEDYVESRRVSARKKLATPSRRSARSSTTTTTTATTTPNSAKSKTASTRQFSQRGRTTTRKDATRGSTTVTLQQQHPQQQQQQQYPTRAHIQGQGFQTQPHVTSHWGVTGNNSTTSSSAPGPAQRRNLGQSPDLDESENLGGRSRNALAQAKHRAKRKAYIKQVSFFLLFILSFFSSLFFVCLSSWEFPFYLLNLTFFYF